MSTCLVLIIYHDANEVLLLDKDGGSGHTTSRVVYRRTYVAQILISPASRRFEAFRTPTTTLTQLVAIRKMFSDSGRRKNRAIQNIQHQWP